MSVSSKMLACTGVPGTAMLTKWSILGNPVATANDPELGTQKPNAAVTGTKPPACAQTYYQEPEIKP